MPFYLIPVLGTLSFFTPCMWNVNLLFRAYIKKGDFKQIPVLFLSRLILFNLIALVFFALSEKIYLPLNFLLFIQGVVAFIFIFGFPIMKKLGYAPVDLSPQFFFPTRSFPPGIGLGFSLPYCALPFVILLGAYSLHFKNAFLFFNLYVFFVTLPTLILPLLPERFLKSATSLIPAVPSITGFMLIIAMGLFIDLGNISLYISSLLEKNNSLLLLLPVSFFLGLFTSLGPSTLPFLPVVLGILVTKHNSKSDIFLSIGGFSIAFMLTHILTGAIASLGTVTLSEIFRTDIFNLLLSALLLLIGLNLTSILSIPVEIAKINPFSDPGTSSFLLGVAYTFSLCPSCTSLLLGAIILSASTGSISKAMLLMGVYAVGRTVPVFLSGFVVNNLSELLRRNYVYINRTVGLIFLLLSSYFLKNFIETLMP